MKFARATRSSIAISLLASDGTPWLNVALVAATGTFALILRGADRVAVLALGVSVLVALYEPRRRVETRRVFYELLAEAVYEACHNLQHLASYTKDHEDGGHKWPEFYVRAAQRLLEPPFAEHTLRVPEIMAVLDHMIRNDDFLRRYELTDDNLDRARASIGYFLEHCIRLVIYAGRAGEERTGNKVQNVIRAIDPTYLTSIALEEDKPFWVRISRRRADSNVAEACEQRKNGKQAIYGLSGEEVRYCWIDDRTPPDPSHSLYEVFKRLSDPPPRPSSK